MDEADVKYLENLIEASTNKARTCTIIAENGNEHFAAPLTINPVAARFRVVKDGLSKGVHIDDLFGVAAMISRCKDPSDGFELRFKGRQPLPSRFLKYLRQNPVAQLQSA